MEVRVAEGKLSQAVAYGARVVKIDGNFDEALDIARDLAEHYQIALVNSVNPDRIEGQKTGAYEIIDSLGDAPDLLFIPVGNAGNITAYWKGLSAGCMASRFRDQPSRSTNHDHSLRASP